jgi:hypothetical protein
VNKPQFPTMLRKMWSGAEVQQWIDDEWEAAWGKLDQQLVEKAAKYDAINTPEIEPFLKAVENEALHQRDRWGTEHDAGKQDTDWIFLIGYLAGKVIKDKDNTLHRIIAVAAACLNWHAAKTGVHTAMRPGIDSNDKE